MENRLFLLFFDVAALSVVFWISSALLLGHRKRSGKPVRAAVWILLCAVTLIPLFLPSRMVSLRLFTDYTGGMRIEFRNGNGEEKIAEDLIMSRKTRKETGTAALLFLTLWTVALSSTASFGISNYWNTLRFLTKNSEECREDRVREIFQRARQRAGIRRSVKLRVMHPDVKMSPCVCGTWSPSVFIGSEYLKAYSDERLEMVFLHELIHIRHHDGLLRLAVLLCTSFHALIPLSGKIRSAVEEDTEYLCDAGVLSRLGEGARLKYTGLLLDIAERNLSEDSVGYGLLSPASEAGELLKKRYLRMKKGKAGFSAKSLLPVAAAVLLNLLLLNLLGAENPDNLRLDFSNRYVEDALDRYFGLEEHGEVTERHIGSVWSLEFYYPSSPEGTEDPLCFYCIVNEEFPERTESGPAYPYGSGTTGLEDLGLFRDLRTLILEGGLWVEPDFASGKGCAVIRR